MVEDQLSHKRCYADDTQIYLSFKPSNSTSEEDAIRVMECCVKKIWRWLTQDRLLVNDDKTEFMVIGTRQQLRKLQAINIKVGSSEIKTKNFRFKNVMERSRARQGTRVPFALALLGICNSSLVKTPFLFR